jgi:hypothetical protein
MIRSWYLAVLIGGVACVTAAHAGMSSPVTVEIIGADGRAFQEVPLGTRGGRDGALRSYLEAEKGARYRVRVRNRTGERVGLVIAVDGRNIINGQRSELERGEPMYVLDAWSTQDYAGWRASLEAINEFYFTDWSDSYAEAFADRSARGVIAIAVFREAVPAHSHRDDVASVHAPAAPPSSAQESEGRAAAAQEKSARRDEAPGTGYGDRRTDRAVHVHFAALREPASRHFIKYEWRETLCRKRVLACGESNRFWDESTVGFAPPPRRRG